MDSVKFKYRSIDYIFWTVFILYSNPGGIFEAIGISTSSGSINISDFFFFMLLGLFMLIPSREIKKDKSFYLIIKALIFFGIYYFFVFGYFVPLLKGNEGHTFFFFLKKTRTTVYSFLFFIIVYHFFLRSGELFYKNHLLISIFVLILFITTIITGIELLPIDRGRRSFTDSDRLFLVSYGFMHILIPIGGVVIVFFKKNFKWKKIMLLAFILMFISWVLSITRRHIFGTFIYIFIAVMLYNYIDHKVLFSLKKLFKIFIYAIVIGVLISFTFPKYLEAGANAIEETFEVIQHGETSSGSKDARLGFGKDFMQNLIKKNKYFGTGFDNRWRTKEGDEQGYEASDYPFLGAIAMTGIFGLLSFLPVYIILINCLIKDLRFLRNNEIDYFSFEFFSLILFIVYFLYDLLQYMNWFSGVSLAGRSVWYIYLAMYLSSRQLFYSSYYKKRKIPEIELNFD